MTAIECDCRREFDGSHPNVFSLGIVNNRRFRQTQSVYYFIIIRAATCFDPTGPSSGLHYEPVNYKAAYIIGIPNNVYKSFFDVLLTVHLSIFISVINQLEAKNFCFTISLFHASTCFEHMCSSSGG